MLAALMPDVRPC